MSLNTTNSLVDGDAIPSATLSAPEQPSSNPQSLLMTFAEVESLIQQPSGNILLCHRVGRKSQRWGIAYISTTRAHNALHLAAENRLSDPKGWLILRSGAKQKFVFYKITMPNTVAWRFPSGVDFCINDLLLLTKSQQPDETQFNIIRDQQLLQLVIKHQPLCRRLLGGAFGPLHQSCMEYSQSGQNQDANEHVTQKVDGNEQTAVGQSLTAIGNEARLQERWAIAPDCKSDARVKVEEESEVLLGTGINTTAYGMKIADGTNGETTCKSASPPPPFVMTSSEVDTFLQSATQDLLLCHAVGKTSLYDRKAYMATSSGFNIQHIVVKNRYEAPKAQLVLRTGQRQLFTIYKTTVEWRFCWVFPQGIQFKINDLLLITKGTQPDEFNMCVIREPEQAQRVLRVLPPWFRHAGLVGRWEAPPVQYELLRTGDGQDKANSEIHERSAGLEKDAEGNNTVAPESNVHAQGTSNEHYANGENADDQYKKCQQPGNMEGWNKTGAEIHGIGDGLVQDVVGNNLVVLQNDIHVQGTSNENNPSGQNTENQFKKCELLKNMDGQNKVGAETHDGSTGLGQDAVANNVVALEYDLHVQGTSSKYYASGENKQNQSQTPTVAEKLYQAPDCKTPAENQPSRLLSTPAQLVEYTPQAETPVGSKRDFVTQCEDPALVIDLTIADNLMQPQDQSLLSAFTACSQEGPPQKVQKQCEPEAGQQFLPQQPNGGVATFPQQEVSNPPSTFLATSDDIQDLLQLTIQDCILWHTIDQRSLAEGKVHTDHCSLNTKALATFNQHGRPKGELVFRSGDKQPFVFNKTGSYGVLSFKIPRNANVLLNDLVLLTRRQQPGQANFWLLRDHQQVARVKCHLHRLVGDKSKAFEQLCTARSSGQNHTTDGQRNTASCNLNGLNGDIPEVHTVKNEPSGVDERGLAQASPSDPQDQDCKDNIIPQTLQGYPTTQNIQLDGRQFECILETMEQSGAFTLLNINLSSVATLKMARSACYQQFLQRIEDTWVEFLRKPLEEVLESFGSTNNPFINSSTRCLPHGSRVGITPNAGKPSAHIDSATDSEQVYGVSALLMTMMVARDVEFTKAEKEASKVAKQCKIIQRLDWLQQ